MTAVSSHALRAGMETAMEAIAEDFLQQRYLFNPDAEVNSLTERIWDLERYGVPRSAISALLADVGAVLESIDRALVHERGVAGLLDESARLLHNAECNHQVTERLTVKSLARALRPHLRTLAADPGALHARREVERIAAAAPVAMLRGKSLRHELRDGPHRLLLSLVDRESAVAA